MTNEPDDGSHHAPVNSPTIDGELDDATKASIDTLTRELQRLYTKLEKNDEGTLSIIQFIVLVFGASIVAADRIPEAVVAVPVFWTVWLMQSRVVDFNTLKLSLYTANIEQQLNSLLQRPYFFWESRMTQRGNQRPMIFNINYAYWAVLNGSAWIAAIAVLVYRNHTFWASALSCAWALLWGAAIRDYRSREQVTEQLRNQLKSGAADIDQPIRLKTDSLRTFIIALALTAAALLSAGATELWGEPSKTTTTALAVATAIGVGAAVILPKQGVELVVVPLDTQ